MLATVLVVLFGLFSQNVRREIAWAYPVAFDQTQYLWQSYETYEQFLAQGVWGGLGHGLALPAPQGMLVHVEAALLFLLLGASRWAALCLNFIHFACFLCVLASTTRALSGRRSVALIAAGIALSAQAPFFYAGGIADFRLDFIAWNLFGVFVTLVVRSRGFLSSRWSMAAGLAALWLCLFRFIVIAYFVGIFGLILAAFAWRAWRTPTRAASRRLRNALIAAAVTIAPTVPVMVWKWPAIHGYYVVGHITSTEKVFRAQEQGVYSIWDALAFYPRSAYVDHAGVVFLVLAAGCLAALAAAAPRLRPGRNWPVPAPVTLALAAMAVGPLVVLTANTAKSPVVGNLIVMPLLWAFVLPMAAIARRMRGHRHSLLLGTAAAVALTTGLATQIDALGRRGAFATSLREHVSAVFAFHDTIHERSTAMGWSRPRLSADFLTDWVHAYTVSQYERHGRVAVLAGGLGAGLAAVTPEEVDKELARSDFVAVTTLYQGAASHYPFEASMREMAPQIATFCRESLVPVKDFRFRDRDVRLFIRPHLGLEGNSGGWITDSGLTLVVLSEVLRARPGLSLRGVTNFSWLGGVPKVEAELLRDGGESALLPSTLTAEGGAYCLGVDARGIDPQGEVARIRLRFDDFFVPKEIGINPDTRRLVIMTPARVFLDKQAGACALGAAAPPP